MLWLLCLASVQAAGDASSDALPSPSTSGMAPAWQHGVGADAVPVLQWLEQNPPRLMHAALAPGGWSEPREIARGEKWFLNWADLPASSRDGSGRTLHTWLPMIGAGAYDYAVRFRFEDAVRDLRVEGRLHDHDGRGEHGFVSLVPLPQGGFFAVWLDGRAHGETGQQLRGRSIRADGSLGPELLLDERCCDCCPTTAVALSDGAVLVAWRDRTAEEIRDICCARGMPEDAASWSEARVVAPDGWFSPG